MQKRRIGGENIARITDTREKAEQGQYTLMQYLKSGFFITEYSKYLRMFYFKQYSNGCLKQGSFKPEQLYISMIAKVILLIYNSSINMNFMSNLHFRCKKLAF